jgi:hypothetical protein
MMRPAAALLLTALLLALLPLGEGLTRCPRTGKIGRCCCTRPTAAPGAHCAMRDGRSACSLRRSTAFPAAMHDLQFVPDRDGTLGGLRAMPSPKPSGRVVDAGFHPPAPFHLSPPTPPPRAFRSA